MEMHNARRAPRVSPTPVETNSESGLARAVASPQHTKPSQARPKEEQRRGLGYRRKVVAAFGQIGLCRNGERRQRTQLDRKRELWESGLNQIHEGRTRQPRLGVGLEGSTQD